MTKARVAKILSFLGIYFLSTGLSFALFNTVLAKSSSVITAPVGKISPVQKAKFKVDPSLPKDQVCPLNGYKFTQKEKDVWEKRRPLAVMIENSEEARPQSGMSRADIVYEALAEGWITRFMAVFYCNTPFENIAVAPVRSARTYFIDWVSEYDALYNHVGGGNTYGENANKTDPRADALGQIDRFGIKDMDQFGISYPDCYRNPDRLDHPVATEHTMVCFSDNLYKLAEKRGWTNVDEKGVAWNQNFKQWLFTDDSGGSKDSKTQNDIKIVFSQGYDKYDAQWSYDGVANSYKRKTGGKEHLDLDTKEQLSTKNIVVQFAKMTGPVDENLHILYNTIGTGKAVIFQNGQAIVGTWVKKSRVGRTLYYDGSGKEIEFVRGPIWIEVIPNQDQLTY